MAEIRSSSDAPEGRPPTPLYSGIHKRLAPPVCTVWVKVVLITLLIAGFILAIYLFR
jgi:hypothetical protein